MTDLSNACLFIYVSLFRYGYTHYLHVNTFAEKNIKFFWQDVACQYWPYAERVTPSASHALQMIPCLPVMHAKAHTWHCQVMTLVIMCILAINIYVIAIIGLVGWALAEWSSCWVRRRHGATFQLPVKMGFSY